MKAKQESIMKEREKKLAQKQLEKEKEKLRQLEAKQAEKNKQKQQVFINFCSAGSFLNVNWNFTIRIEL